MNYSSARWLLVFLMCAVNVMSENKPKKEKPFDGTTVEQFSEPLKTVIDAGHHNFESIKSDFDLVSNDWKTTTPLPGTASCQLSKSEREIKKNILTPEFYIYFCTFSFKGGRDKVMGNYERLVSYVSQVTGWKYEPTPGYRPNGTEDPKVLAMALADREVIFKGSREGDPSISISARPDYVKLGTALMIFVRPDLKIQVLTSQSLTSTSSGDSNENVRAEIDEIKNSGRFVTMPASVRTGNRNWDSCYFRSI